MKQVLIGALMLASFISHAQKTVIDEKFVEGENPVGYRLKKNTLYIAKGEQVKMRSNCKIAKVDAYTTNGDKKRVIDGESFSLFFPSYQFDDVFMGVEYSPGRSDRKYFVKGTPTSIKQDEFIKDRNTMHIGIVLNFSDKYLFGLTNQDAKSKIDFAKDDVYLETMDLKTKSISRSKIEKPDMSRLTGANFIKPKHNIGFQCRIKKDNTIEMITKSIAGDYKASTLYRTFYNLQGKKTGEISCNIEIPDYVLVDSNNGGGEVEPISQTEPFQDDALVYNFLENTDNGDFYVYGLFAKESAKLNDRIKAAGYYVFKFDKKGTQLWKSINVIDDKKGFNNNHYPINTIVTVQKLGNKLLFSTDVNDNDEFTQYAVLEEATGKILSNNKIVYHQEMNKNKWNQFVVSDMEIESIKEDRNFNVDAIIAFDMSKEVENYVRSVKSKKDIQFEAVFSEAGIWLLESDNKDYYKVLLFEIK